MTLLESDWCSEFAPRTATLPHRRDDEANAAFDAAAHDDATDATDATDANRGANVGKCQRGRYECQTGIDNATDRRGLGTPPETKRP